MKFTDGFWQVRKGVDALYAQEAHDLEQAGDGLVVTATTRPVVVRGDTLNQAVLTVSLRSPAEGVIAVRIEHHRGGKTDPGFTHGEEAPDVDIRIDDDEGVLTSGPLAVRVSRRGPWRMAFESNGAELTRSAAKSIAYLRLAPHAEVDALPLGNARAGTTRHLAAAYLHQQLSLGVGEHIYGLGERFGPLVKNGQSIDIWNADGGTSSEQAYKNVPFYMSSRGYGVLVNTPEHVSYEVGSEAVERVQFSVEGEALEYWVFAGPTPAEVLDRYSRLFGRPAEVPAWSFGLWLSTSFTTDYDEQTVTGMLDELQSQNIPVSVFHFDCFWMREFNWCDFTWDPRVFPDPDGMLDRLHDRGLRVCVWINPYIAQRSPLFDEAAREGLLVQRADGSIWQWDLWQPGMALVDFTNPRATRWFQEKLRVLVKQGVDTFKTDFGERIPTDVVYWDGSRPERMHNYYTQLYNQAVVDVLREERGDADALVFARSATVGGQALPVHWGGDSTSTFESMAETLRGGLSLASSGFAYWSHDIGGFEGTPDTDVFKRWVAFGLLSSHSRLHGSSSHRIPGAFDDEAVRITRSFTELKLALMPYLWEASRAASTRGTPVMRPMAFAFPNDLAVTHLDRQYMLGPDILVAPVFASDGTVDFYLPAGRWTHLLTGQVVDGGSWRREVHDFDSLPIYVRDGAVLPIGAGRAGPDYDYLDGLTLAVFPGPTDGSATIDVAAPNGDRHKFTITWTEGLVRAVADTPGGWTLAAGNGRAHAVEGVAQVQYDGAGFAYGPTTR